jgi:hypothetical protein
MAAKSLTIAERTARNLNPHAAATFAMWHWHERYADQGGGVMDFWDDLTRHEKQFCCDAVAAIGKARKR